MFCYFIAKHVAPSDSGSRMLQIAEDTKRWYARYPHGWQKSRQLLWQKYTPEDNRIRDTNGSELNTGAILGPLTLCKLSLHRVVSSTMVCRLNCLRMGSIGQQLAGMLAT